MGPGAGLRWLMNALNLGGRNPRAVFGGAALLMLVALVPTVVQLVVQEGLGIHDQAIVLGLVGFSLLYSLLLMGPLSAGYLRVLHAAETGAPTRATAIFGVLAGMLAAWGIVAKVMTLDFVWLWPQALLAAGGALAFTVLLGLAGTWRILGKKPAPYLRSL